MGSMDGQTLAIVNGRVWTGAGHTEAVAFRNGRVALVGGNDEVRRAVPAGSPVVDVEGRRVVPGLIDSHTHFVRAGLTWTEIVRWDDVRSLTEGLERIRNAAERTPPHRWIRVMGGWQPGMFAERRGPTREELDEVAPHHPVYVQLLYEEALLNTEGTARALEGSDVDGIERNADGLPTGTIRGTAAFRHVTSLFDPPEMDAQVTSTVALARDFSALGVTGVIDPGGFGMSPESYEALFHAWEAGSLPIRVRLYLVPSRAGAELAETREWVRYIHPHFGDDMLRYIGMGEILSFACHDMEGVRPYTVPEEGKRDLLEITRLLVAHEWPAHVHAILDSTIGTVLDVWEQVDAEVGLAGRRFSLAHAEPIGRANLERVRALGAGIAVQNRLMFRAADSAALWGDEVAAHSPPLRDMLDLGITVGAGTDATVVAPHDPWRCLWWLVTGKSVDGAPPRAERHRLTIEEALRAYTTGSAWFSFEDHERGTLTPGAWADAAVLDLDPFSLDPERLPEVRSELTILGGAPVHTAEAFAGLDT